MATKVVVSHDICGLHISREAMDLGRKLSGNPDWNGWGPNEETRFPNDGPNASGQTWSESFKDQTAYYDEHGYRCDDLDRTDLVLIQVLEQLGVKALPLRDQEWVRIATEEEKENRMHNPNFEIVVVPTGRKYRFVSHDLGEYIEYDDKIEWSIG